jgi:aminoglycoside phosphotransferase (APT) family kinase protein
MLSAEVARWLVASAGGEVVTVERMGGSSSASVFLCRLDGRREDVVVKVYDRAGGPDRAEAEELVRGDVRGLAAATAIALPIPEVVAADPSGAETGVPVIAMTALSGRAEPRPPADADGWVAGMADALRAIAVADISPVGLALYVPWHEPEIRIPPWATDPGPWREASSLLLDDLPCAEWRFVHRDFHPLNVLWDGGRVSGVVDWPNACVGPIEADIARCRVNMALVSDPADPLALADRFVERTGLPYDRRWDLTIVASALPDGAGFLVGNEIGAGLTADGVRATLEAILRAIVD